VQFGASPDTLLITTENQEESITPPNNKFWLSRFGWDGTARHRFFAAN
jgi:hypothetical protein